MEEKPIMQYPDAIKKEVGFLSKIKQGQLMRVVPAKTLRQSGDPDQKKGFLDFRPMTLRRQVSLVLPFAQPVGLDQRASDFRGLALRHRLSTILPFR